MANTLEYILKIRDEATAQLQKFGSSIESGRDSLKSFGESAMKTGALITAATIPLTLYAKSAFTLATDIESAWVGVRKVYDGAASDVEDLLIPSVKNLSIEYGKNKLEIIGVMDALAAMGASGPDLINKTTQALQFSVLGSMELDQAMKAVVATSAIFGVKGEELTKMLASMNTAENTGAASMSDLADAISTTGNVAKVSGVSVKELNAMMSVLRQRGVDAGEAANSLKTILTKLRAPSEDGKAIMDKYGISIYETTQRMGTFTKTVGGNADEMKRLQKVVDSKTTSLKNYQAGISGANLSADAMKKKQANLTTELGNAQKALQGVSGVTSTYTGMQTVLTDKMKDADVVLSDIAKNWSKMTDAEKSEMAQSAGMLYQKDKFLALMDDLSSSTSEYSKLLQAQGDDAQNVAGYYKELGIAQDSNAFKIQQATQRFAELKAQIGEIIVGYLAPIITKVSELALKFSELNPNVLKIVTALGLFLIILGPLIALIGGIAFILATVSGTVLAVAAAVVGLTTIFIVFGDQIKAVFDNVGTYFSQFAETFNGYLEIIKGQAKAFTERLYDTFNLNSDNVSLGDFFRQIWEKAKPELDNIVAQIKQGFKNALQMNFGEGGNGGDLLGRLAGIATTVSDLFFRLLTPAINSIKTAFEQASPFIDKLLQQLGPLMINVLQILVGAIAAAIVIFLGLFTALVEAVSAALPFIIQMITGFVEILNGIIQIIVGIFTLNFQMIWDGIKLIFQGIFDTITGALSAVLAFIGGFIQGVIDFFQNLYDTLIGHSIIPDMVNGIIAWFTTLKTKASDIVNNIKTKITDTWNSIKTSVSDTVSTMVTFISDKFETMYSKVVDIKDRIVAKFRDLADGITNALKSIKFPHLSIGEGSTTVAGKEIKYPKLDVDWYEKGGWVGNTGLAMVHEGEFVLSKDMLHGKKELPQGVTNNFSGASVNVSAIVNNTIGALELGNIIGQQLAFAGR